jgi:hypothetical protein
VVGGRLVGCRLVGRAVERSSGWLGAVGWSAGRLVGWSAVGWSAVGWSAGRLVVTLLTVGGGVESVVCVRDTALWRADAARIGG